MITDEILLNAGYKQFKTGLEFHPTAEVGFQKGLMMKLVRSILLLASNTQLGNILI